MKAKVRLSFGKNKPLTQTLNWFGLILITFSSLACTQESSEPVSEELIVTRPPTFYNQSQKSFTFPSSTVLLPGECDPISKGLEYSYDQLTWISIAAGCVDSGFTLSLVIPRSSTIYVRALTKKGFTSAAAAKIRLELPPTSTAFQAVVAGNAVEEGRRSVQFSMSSGVEGKKMSGASFQMDSNVTGVVYGQ